MLVCILNILILESRLKIKIHCHNLLKKIHTDVCVHHGEKQVYVCTLRL